MAYWSQQPVPNCVFGYGQHNQQQRLPPPPYHGHYNYANYAPNHGYQNGYQNGYQQFNNYQGRGGYRYPGHFNPRGRGHSHWTRGSRGGGGPIRFSHKPWMTPELKHAIKERDQAQQKALMTKDPDDWSIYKALRNRATLSMNDAKVLFEQKIEEERGSSKLRSEFYCDTCDRSFDSDDLFIAHNAGHVTCKLDGCTFTAHPKVLLKHIEMQHSGNLFARVKGYNSPEEIIKWKEERKNNYPTTENIEKKQKTKAEQFKRGERIPTRDFRKRKDNNNRFQQNRTEKKANYERNDFKSPRNVSRDVLHNNKYFDNNNKTTTTSNQMTDSSNQSFSRPRSVSSRPNNDAVPQNDKTNEPSSQNLVVLENFFAQVRVGENGNLVGKKFMEWNSKCQDLCQKGISCIGKAKFGSDGEDEDSQDELILETCITDEEEDKTTMSISSKGNNVSIEKIFTPNSSIDSLVNLKVDSHSATPKEKSTALLGLVAYSSDSDCDGPEEIPTVVIKEDGEISEGEVVEESIINASTPVEGVVSEHNDSLEPSSSPPMTATTSASSPNKINNNDDKKWSPKKKNYTKPNVSHAMKKRKQPKMSRLLRMLLEDDIRRERNEILQVCRFICENNFFDDSSKPPPSNM